MTSPIERHGQAGKRMQRARVSKGALRIQMIRKFSNQQNAQGNKHAGGRHLNLNYLYDGQYLKQKYDVDAYVD